MSYLAARRPGAAGMQRAVELVPSGGPGGWQRLVQAEQDTADALEDLGPDWSVLHSVPVGPGRATLPHLAIGPGGLFAIVSVPPRAPVVELAAGQAQLSRHGIDDMLAQARQLAQRVRTALVRRLGGGADVLTVHPVVCLTGDLPLAHRTAVCDDREVVALDRLTALVLARPQLLSSASTARLVAVASDPATWDAPQAEWLPADLQARYADALGLDEPAPAQVPRPEAISRVVAGTVTASGPPDFPARGAAVRTASVVMIVLGVASLASGGLLSLPSLVYGGLFLRRRGGLGWLNDKDGALFLVGLVLAGLPLLFWILLLPVVLGGTG